MFFQAIKLDWIIRSFVRSFHRLTVICLAVGLVLMGQAEPAAAATQFAVNLVTDLKDLKPGDGRCDAIADATKAGDQCTLRAAIMEANLLPGHDTIVLPATAVTLMLPGQNEDAGATGDLDIKTEVTIKGTGASSSIINGNELDVVFHVHPGGVAVLSDLTVLKGVAPNGAGGVINVGHLTITRSTITQNTVTSNFGSGGVLSGGTLNIINSTIHGNSSEGGIGGVGNMEGGILNIVNSTVSGNTGMGIMNGGTAANLNYVTVANNAGAGTFLGEGAGIVAVTPVTIKNTVIAGNHTGDKAGDCAGTLVSGGYNLVGTLSVGCEFIQTTGDQASKNAKLGKLQNNGGATLTHALLTGSPAIDSAAPGAGCPAKDQRGITRPVDGNVDGTTRCDIGAIEFNGAVITSLSPASGTVGANPFTLTVKGTRFTADSKIRWNGQDRPTTFVDSTTLRTTIFTADLPALGTATVQVNTAGIGGGMSNAKLFSIINPKPTIASLSATKAVAGSDGFDLIVNGSGFVTGAKLHWNGTERVTPSVGWSQLTAHITAADLAAGGVANVTIVNPAPGGGSSNAVAFTINNPWPNITSLSQNVGLAGATGFTLTVKGKNFVETSTVRWNGLDRSTTYVDSATLKMTVTTADLALGGTRYVSVKSPAPGGGLTGSLVFTIINPFPTVTGMNPASALVGTKAMTPTITGTGFVPGTKVVVNGVDHTTYVDNATTLRVVLTAADFQEAGVRTIRVRNPTPVGGLSSTSTTFTVKNLVPMITSINPTSVKAGSVGFELIVTGKGFNKDSTVRWNGLERGTELLNSTTLKAVIPASDIGKAGTANVAVFNAGPGGGWTGALKLAIVP